MIVYQSRIYLNCKGGEQQSINFPTTAAVVSSRSIMTAAASTAPSICVARGGGGGIVFKSYCHGVRLEVESNFPHSIYVELVSGNYVL